MYLIVHISNNIVVEQKQTESKERAVFFGVGMVEEKYPLPDDIRDGLNKTYYFHHDDWSLQILTLD